MFDFRFTALDGLWSVRNALSSGSSSSKTLHDMDGYLVNLVKKSCFFLGFLCGETKLSLVSCCSPKLLCCWVTPGLCRAQPIFLLRFGGFEDAIFTSLDRRKTGLPSKNFRISVESEWNNSKWPAVTTAANQVCDSSWPSMVREGRVLPRCSSYLNLNLTQ